MPCPCFFFGMKLIIRHWYYNCSPKSKGKVLCWIQSASSCQGPRSWNSRYIKYSAAMHPATSSVTGAGMAEPNIKTHRSRLRIILHNLNYIHHFFPQKSSNNVPSNKNGFTLDGSKLQHFFFNCPFCQYGMIGSIKFIQHVKLWLII